MAAKRTAVKRTAVKRTRSGGRKTLGVNDLPRLWFDINRDAPDGTSGSPNKPYSQVELVFACVSKLIGAISGLPPVLSDINERVIESGPAYDILFNNPLASWDRFVTETIGHYALSRDVFWVFTDMDGVAPMEIAVVSGLQMHAVTDTGRSDGQLIGWEFRGTAGKPKKFSISEVWQWKNFNPYDRYHGLGPATAARLSIDYSYAASMFNTSALKNGAELGVILTTPSGLTPPQVEMLRGMFDARHAGPSQAKRTAVLTGGMDVKTVAQNMVNMDVAALTAKSDNKICACFEVPPPIVGLITEAQYSHGPAQKDFIFNTIMPLAQLFAGNITSGILSRFYTAQSQGMSLKDARLCRTTGSLPLHRRAAFRAAYQKALAQNRNIFFWLDCGQHPVVQEAQREIAKNVLEFTKAGVTLNDIIDAHDLPYTKQPWGDEWLVSMGMVPARYILEAGLEGLTGPSLPEEPEEPEPEKPEDEDKAVQLACEAANNLRSLSGDIAGGTKDQDAPRRLRIWRNWVISWAGIEKEYTEAMRLLFVRQQRVLTAALKTALGESKSVKADSEQVIAKVIFDLKKENGKLKVINRVFFEKASELGSRQSLSEIAGLTGDALEDAVKRIKLSPKIYARLIQSSQKISGVNATTQRMVAQTLRRGLEGGEGLNELTARIREVLGSNRARARGIARTQTAGAVNTGRHEGYRDTGVELKSWLTSGDANVRQSHRNAGIQYAAGIALDVAYEVGGDRLMFPGDPSGSAAQIINCRCASIALRAKGKVFDLQFYSNLKFYSYCEMRGLHNGT